jgi:hypothetical protein
LGGRGVIIRGMGNDVGKVERLGLGRKVRALWVAGVRSGREIARRIEEETL